MATIVVFYFFVWCSCFFWHLADLARPRLCVRARAGALRADNPQNWVVQTAPKTGRCSLIKVGWQEWKKRGEQREESSFAMFLNAMNMDTETL